MSEAKKVTIGVVSGVLSIAVLFALILMIVCKGDEPTPRPQPILARQPKPVPPKPAPVQCASSAATQVGRPEVGPCARVRINGSLQCQNATKVGEASRSSQPTSWA